MILPRPPLPHAFPFLLLDRLLLRQGSGFVVALKNVSRNDPLTAPDGSMPRIFLLEMMAQAAGLAASPKGSSTGPGFLVRVDRFRCRATPRAGDRLLVAAKVVRRLGQTVKVHASVRIEARIHAASELVLRCGETT